MEKSLFNSIWLYYSYRPWYIASATPHPKDVVLLVKNNLFPQDSVRARQYEAADIILRTLNPKDKVIFHQTNGGGWHFHVGPVLFNYTFLNTLVYKNKQHIIRYRYLGKGPKLKVYLRLEFMMFWSMVQIGSTMAGVCAIGNTSWAN